MAKEVEPKRLVKLVLPAALVRQMDQAILASAGAYQDRNEYIAEAIRDLLVEEAALNPSAVPTSRGSAALVEPQPKFVALIAPDLDDSVELGRWRANPPTTVPTPRSDAVNFGLHNRDYPTLWALDQLASFEVERQAPVEWDDFVRSVRDVAAHAGGLLRGRDLAAPTSLAVGVGFPKPGAKQANSIDRFISANIGSPRRRDGAFFVLSLAALLDGDAQRVAPTDAGLTVLGEMIDRGLGATLPQPMAAFECWWEFLAEYAPEERAAWHKVLRVVAESPTREDLVQRFPEWAGSQADTNTTGFVSRSREWGLVQPDLIDGRYQLTDLGSAVVREE